MPCCSSRYAAWQSGSRKIATRTLRPRISSLPADCTCAAARWITRWKPSVCCGVTSTRSGSDSSFSSKNCSSARFSVDDVAAAVAHDLGDVGVVEQRVEHVLDAEELVPAATRLVDGERAG